ncbi:50S ribosomal protein L9 [Hyphobacterium sp. HN65]|uniref:Large ribosomal subunit protein bL9 n=1 Tax=Hyphobacterium lacteum TaxID=3116575 RepID=A0ABU7LMC8_9PROT|nr:50S ribosomal protein L9 [Hyphobacterium sp. HN65]MEE2524761.1 50S ribosomal protein L9 [Hyphobacterium sp. HN65]
MQVILLERVDNLGAMGEEVTVKPGYARNFLLPQEKALRATEANRKRFEAQREALEKRNAERRDEAAKSADGVDGETFIMIRQAGETGHLYGSVTTRDIADAVSTDTLKVARSMVVLHDPIKTLGLHEVEIKLHPEVTITVSINVARSEDEAERQAAGEDVIAAQADEDRAIAEAQAAELFEAGAEPEDLIAAEENAEIEAEAAAEAEAGEEEDKA